MTEKKRLKVFRENVKKLCSHFFLEKSHFQTIMLTNHFLQIVGKGSFWNLKLDIYKCPFLKTKSRIYFLVVTRKKGDEKCIIKPDDIWSHDRDYNGDHVFLLC